jgi:hypothetical protein
MPRIHTFVGQYICFFRRNKKTYYALKWDNTSRKWLRSNPLLPDLTLHRSNVSREGNVTISVATYANGAAKIIPITADGFYIKSGDIRIPILKARNSLGQAFMMREYTALDTPFTQTDERLWSIQVVPPPIEIPVPPLAVLQEKIPKRIAWLIAEDASKTGETCPISTNTISPITASVTTCYHVFETDAINEWVQRNPVNTPCPVCRKPCEVTVAFVNQ